MRKKYSQLEAEQILLVNGDKKVSIPVLLEKPVLEYVAKLKREFNSHLIDGKNGLSYRSEYFIDDQGAIHYTQDVAAKRGKFDQSISKLGMELTNLEIIKSGYRGRQTRSFYLTAPVKDHLERTGELAQIKSTIDITEEVL